MLKPINGIIALCIYCGEQVGNTQKYCKQCKTKDGRQEILNQNLEILNKLRENGYCKNEVLLPNPK